MFRNRLILEAAGIALGCVLGIISPLRALASDGVVEVNQSCAAQSGCFAGDTAGYPITITGTAGRSYRLTSDLIVPDENTDGVVMSTPSVSLDLNGFQIVRSGCESATTNCRPASGTGAGVTVSSQGSIIGVSVRNGSVVGMGSHGISLGHQAELINLRVRWNRENGLFASVSAVVRDVTAFENGFSGIHVGTNSVVRSSTTQQNGAVGIVADGGSVIIGNSVTGNLIGGISASEASTVKDNALFGNEGHAILLGPTSGYSGNTIATFEPTQLTVSGGVATGTNACDGVTVCP